MSIACCNESSLRQIAFLSTSTPHLDGGGSGEAGGDLHDGVTESELGEAAQRLELLPSLAVHRDVVLLVVSLHLRLAHTLRHRGHRVELLLERSTLLTITTLITVLVLFSIFCSFSCLFFVFLLFLFNWFI